MAKLNHRIKDLRINAEDMELLNSIAEDLGMKNTTIARLILHQQLQQIRSDGMKNFSLAIVGKSNISANKEVKTGKIPKIVNVR